MGTRDTAVVLLAEDNVDHAELIKRSMRRAYGQLRIVHLEDGESALEYVQRRGAFADPGGYPAPAFILLDLRLPHVDGLPVLKTIKPDTALRHIPLVVLSSSEADRDTVAAIESYANSCVEKSFGHERFGAMVQALAGYWLDSHRAN